ncbi:MAG: transcription-repair coupling factor [Chloroflexi bacterium]|nr:transcription-repair coupling factor [Chloroflexota bacterium]
MRLAGLLDLPAASSTLDHLFSLLRTRPVVGIPEAAKAYVLAALARRASRPLVVITPRPQRARELAAQLATWCDPKAEVLLYPEVDAVPFERTGSDSYTLQQRLTALAALVAAPAASPAERFPLVVAGVPAALQKTLPPARFAAAVEVLRPGARLPRNAALARWLRLGYRHVATVDAPGTVAHRGGILDIFPPNSELPVRIELWGDTIDNLRWFDPVSQRSVRLAEAVPVVPAREFALSEPGDRPRRPRLTLSDLEPESRERFGRELGLLAEGEPFEGMDFYAPLLPCASLLDYLPDGALLVLDEPEDCAAVGDDLLAQVEEARRSQVARGLLPPEFPLPLFSWEDLRARVATHHGLTLGRWTREEAEDHYPQPLTQDGERGPGGESHRGGSRGTGLRLPFAPVPAYGGRLRLALREIRRLVQEGRRVVVLSHQAARLAELLQDEDLIAQPVEEVPAPPAPGSLTLVHGSVGSGWALLDRATVEDEEAAALERAALILVTDAELFGFAKAPVRAPRRRPAAPRRENPLAALRPGDYVVHIEHGIGRFGGVARQAQDGVLREYLVLDYGAGDRLYVPVDQVDRVSRYIGPADHEPTLSRLGTAEWSRAKERVQKATAALAQELLATQAGRQLVPGHAFPYDTPWQQEIEASFPYVETPDQLQVLREVKEDMERPRPMDRLVCGDVGYGKTEVALRAAFKAVMDGMQVAVLVPTTVLAQQHYHTFRDRMAPFPVRIETLSRLRTPEEQGQVLEGLRQGKVDIVIGTHRLLQKDVQFKDLGLAVIDDEHRFGVAHKERLKQMRRQVDVLTMTATPIPRTLYMALSGIRDISNIHTPPEMRQAVQTFVSEYSDDLAREAIQRELDRGGQVFFLHNRVKDINYWAAKVRELVPQARVGVGHGQMDERELEDVMAAFASGELDVLVCTTIIEAGLDLPRANTILCHRAELLGLAQMHQLRGRVGRGGQRAFAYFLVEPGKRLTEAAERRLKAILAASELGAGFRIAMKDLEIRGAGNVLGPEQSGQVHAVGFDLYVRLLEEAVRELRAGQEAQPVPMAIGMAPSDVTVDLPLAAYIPEDYIADLPVRLEVYGRLARATTVAEAAALAEELRDRFGPPPEPVKELLYVVRLKALASQAGVEAITRDGRQIVLRLREPAGGARLLLQKELDPVAKVGHQQVRLEFKGRWQGMLEWTLQRTAAFRARVLAMVQG